jgi:nucleotide-binding universal stress UspA family protein
MKTILVGIDHSECSRAALHWAAGVTGRIADVARAPVPRVIAVAAWEPRQAELPPDEAQRERNAVVRLLDMRASEVNAEPINVETEMLDGTPADVLLRAADAHSADLVVIGTRGEGGFAALQFGSVADHLAHHTTRPLAVVPAGAWPEPRHLVLGVDGSEGSTAATRWCASFASDCDAGVTAVACNEGKYPLRPGQDPKDVLQYMEHALHDQWTRPLRHEGITTRFEVSLEPHVSDALLEACNRRAANALVVGTHGLAAIAHVRLGGVTMELLRDANLPLIIVPPE